MANQQMSVTMTGFAASHPNRHQSIPRLVTFRMASTPRWNDKGEWKDGGTLFIEVQCWGKLGDHVMQSVVKGAPLVIAGRMTSYTFTPDNGSRQAGEGPVYKETIWRVTATNVGLDLSHSPSSWSLRDRVKEAPEGGVRSAGSAENMGGFRALDEAEGAGGGEAVGAVAAGDAAGGAGAAGDAVAADTAAAEPPSGDRELSTAGHQAPF
jgi:single-strand DNA-binding protein